MYHEGLGFLGLGGLGGLRVRHRILKRDSH